MDHATFEKRSAKTKEFIESASLPLALSSHIRFTDFNPIEHCWHTIKSSIRPRMAQQQNLLLVGNAINRGVSFSLGNTILPKSERAMLSLHIEKGIFTLDLSFKQDLSGPIMWDVKLFKLRKNE